MENDDISTTPIVNSSLDFQDLESYGQKCEPSFSDSSDELDEEKCYLMEIEQLKRENNFLRKKLEETNKKKRLSVPLGATRKPSFNFGSSANLKPEEPRHFIISFIDEIVKLL